MKNFIAILLVLTLCFSLCACSNETANCDESRHDPSNDVLHIEETKNSFASAENTSTIEGSGYDSPEAD